MRAMVFRYGLSIGAAQILVLWAALFWLGPEGVDRHRSTLEKAGYPALILSLGFIFLGVRRYRDAVPGALMGYWRAAAAGLNMAAVAAVALALGAWTAYRFAFPGFLSELLRLKTKRIRESSEAPQAVIAEFETLAAQKDFLLDPAMQAGLLFFMAALCGIPIALLSAAILRKKQ